MAAKDLDKAEKFKTLTEIVRDKGAEHRDRLSAIKIHNDMTGDNAPVQHKHDVSLNQLLTADPTELARIASGSVKGPEALPDPKPALTWDEYDAEQQSEA